MRTRDIMSPRVAAIAYDADAGIARDALQENDADYLIVMDGVKAIGVVSREAVAQARDEQPITQLMSREIVAIAPGATLRRAADLIRHRPIAYLPVIAEGTPIGILPRSVLLQALAKRGQQIASFFQT